MAQKTEMFSQPGVAKFIAYVVLPLGDIYISKNLE